MLMWGIGYSHHRGGDCKPRSFAEVFFSCALTQPELGPLRAAWYELRNHWRSTHVTGWPCSITVWLKFDVPLPAFWSTIATDSPDCHVRFQVKG
jgi:hypothetical protein